jgi:putative (di)nucleoside polyphosphate hydrolase
MASETFRAGVGAVIVNDANLVLALERLDVPGAWQMAQGGLHPDEDPLEGAKREIREETGIEPSELSLMFPIERLLAYEIPPNLRSRKTGRGQVQYWFVFRFLGKDDDITLGERKEFGRWKWSSIDELVEHVVAFKRPVYEELALRLSSALRG